MALLLGRLRIVWGHELARDVAIAAFGIDHGAYPAPLGNGLHFHVISGTRFLRRRFSRAQLGGCLNRSKPRPNEAIKSDRIHVQVQRGTSGV